jgi:PAS domain S-box-containing protein
MASRTTSERHPAFPDRHAERRRPMQGETAHGPTLQEALEALCLVLLEHGSGLMPAVLVPDRSGTRWQTVAGPGVPEVWRRTLHETPIGPTAGASGAAIVRRRKVVAADLATDPLYADLRPAALAAGLRACWAMPLLSTDGRPLGVFALYSRRPRRPSGRELRIMDAAAELARLMVERSLADQDLRTRERRWRSIFDNSAIGIAVSTLGGRFVVTNRAYQALVGYSGEELEQMTWVELTHEDDRMENLQRAAELSSDEIQVEKRYRRRDGRIIWVRATSSVISEGEGMGPLRMALIEDITDRKRAEDALRGSEARLAEAQRIGHTGSWVFNHETGALLWSDEMFRICGFDPAAGPPTCQMVFERIHPDDAARAGESIRQAIQEGRDFEGEYRLLIPGDGFVDLHYLGHPVVTAAGEPVEFVGTMTDITARKRAEERLQDSLTEVRRLAARQMQAQDEERRRIARELHETTAQDLAALKMNLVALDRSGALSRERDRALLEESAALAERSMNDIRTLSYLLHPPFLDEVGLTSALRWFANGFAKRSGVEVHLDLPDEFGRFPQEIETTLFRMVQECLINIHRHAHSRAAAIRLRMEPGQLVIEVQDWGRGMPRDARVEHAVDGGAMGVGIAGMRERMKQLGGELEIRSGAQGTTVRALLPLSSARP